MEMQSWEIWKVKLEKGEREIKLLKGWIASAVVSQGRRSWTLERKNRDRSWRPMEGAGKQKAYKEKSQQIWHGMLIKNGSIKWRRMCSGEVKSVKGKVESKITGNRWNKYLHGAKPRRLSFTLLLGEQKELEEQILCQLSSSFQLKQEWKQSRSKPD